MADSKRSARPLGVSCTVFAALIANKHTDFVINNYSDRVFINVSQCGRIGNLYMVKKESAAVPNSTTIYSVKTLLGTSDDATTVAVRALAEKLSTKSPLLISLSLCEPVSARNVAIIAELIEKNFTQKNLEQQLHRAIIN